MNKSIKIDILKPLALMELKKMAAKGLITIPEEIQYERLYISNFDEISSFSQAIPKLNFEFCAFRVQEPIEGNKLFILKLKNSIPFLEAKVFKESADRREKREGRISKRSKSLNQLFGETIPKPIKEEIILWENVTEIIVPEFDFEVIKGFNIDLESNSVSFEGSQLTLYSYNAKIWLVSKSLSDYLDNWEANRRIAEEKLKRRHTQDSAERDERLNRLLGLPKDQENKNKENDEGDNLSC
jgi:hypothetical protein